MRGEAECASDCPHAMIEPVTVPCQSAAFELAGDGPELQLELTNDDELITTV